MNTTDQYLCWCDADTSCSHPADEPFGLCAECKQFGHSPLPKGNLDPKHLLIDGSED